MRLFHAFQNGVYYRVHMYDTPDKHAEMCTNTACTGDADAPHVVGYGDIHSAFVKSFGNKILFNVGSVGNPLDVTQAYYAVLEGVYSGNINDVFAVQLVRVPYDIEEAIRQAAAEQMPHFEAYANELRTARYRSLAVNV